ncbi:Flp family type IVb pilin [Pararhizobium antarcticum]|uniref:Pilin n=1 Tax=Pararhizobium antarcticum TaxID=1798805 RepID=A0A657LLD9_9HYPH|nr:Flp family type IVb pilin [Pararhizobium antarcticum]OJF90800.1 pilin [Pararhizobium antarcticum]OJG01301.1 pilin [Rhizobium sp. 58]
MRTFIRILANDTGATAIEYGLLAALISIGLLVGLQSFSDQLLIVLTTIKDAIVNAGT